MSLDPVSRYAVLHLVAAHAGIGAFRAAAAHHRGSASHAALEALTADVEEDCRRLDGIVASLGADVSAIPHRIVRAALVSAGRAQGVLHRFGAVSELSEIEKLLAAVGTKAAGWDTLLEAAREDDRLSVSELEELRGRAERQSEVLRGLHREAIGRVLTREPRAET